MNEINVRDFGAKGDGRADDTAAINAAFAAMRQAAINTHPTLPRFWGGAEWFPATCPAVVFPSGHYQISDAINIAGRFTSLTDRDMGARTIRGDNAVIDQRNPDKDIFVSPYSVMTHVTGFTFVGGRHQVWLDNPNVGAFLKVTDCEFDESSGFAVVFGYKCMSTLAYLACCVFNCEQWIYTMCDVATFRDVHGGIRSGTANKAAFDLRGGIVTMDNIMATPWVDAPDQRFIDNRCATLKLSNWRFGGEFGGFLPIRNFRKYDRRPAYQSSITVDNCLLPNQGNTKRPCAIYCDEVPNRIVVANSTVVGIPVIMVDPRLDLNNYFVGLADDMLKFAVENCTGQIGDLPEGLKHPVVVPAAGDAGQSDAEVAQRLQAAAAFAASVPAWQGAPATFGGHREQTDPANYVSLPGTRGQWTVAGHADAEATLNAKLYAVAARNGQAIIMPRHRRYGNGWALLQDVTIDLDQHPWLTYRLKRFDYGYMPCKFRVIDKESGHSLLCNPPDYGGQQAPAYYAYDLRKAFGGGVHTFDIRVYIVGAILCAKDDPAVVAARARGERRSDEVETNDSDVLTMYNAGDGILLSLEDRAYTVLEFVRAEAE